MFLSFLSSRLNPKSLILNFGVLAALSSSLISFADETPSAIKEMIMKGSVDGKHIHLVLGIDDALKIDKKLLGTAVRLDKIKSEGKYLNQLMDQEGSFINSKDHEDDYDALVSSGAKIAKKHSKEILAHPWKSLEKVPGAFQADIKRGQEAFYGSKNQAVGAMKFTGWAVMAVIEDAYYMVIEAPAELAYESFATILPVPGAAIAQTIRIAAVGGWAGLVLGFDVARESLRLVDHAVATVVTDAYAITSEVLASAVLVAARGGVAIYDGAKWVSQETFGKIKYIERTSVATEVDVKDQQKAAKAIETVLADSSKSGIKDSRVESGIDEYRSIFKVFTKNASGKEELALVVKTTIDNKNKVEITALALRKYFKSIRKETAKSRKEVKKELKSELDALVEVLKKAA